MKKIIISICFSFLIIQNAAAYSWTNDKGETTLFDSLYYSYTKPSYQYNTFDTGQSYKIKDNNYRVATTMDLQYGARSDVTLYAKLDLGVEHDTIYTQLDNIPGTQFFKVTSDFGRLESEFGFRKRLYETETRVLANSWSFYPGDLIFGHENSYHLHRKAAVETRIQYGQNYQHQFWFSKYFKCHKDPNLYHYFEWEGGIKYYPEAKHPEFEFDIAFGFRPGTNWELGVALYNTFNQYNFDNKPYNRNTILRNVNNFITLAADQQTEIYDAIIDVLQTESNSRLHQINFKIDYVLAPERTIGIETSSSVFNEKPFKNNTIMLNYGMSF